MKTLSYNVRGLGSSRVVHRLQQLLKLHNPQMVFLMEPKIDGSHMKRVSRKCGFFNGIEMDANGTKDGLCLG